MSGAAGERILALFPGGLGDLLCCWPALDGLCHATGAALTLAARESWFAALPDGAVTPLSIDRRELADLFSPAPLGTATRRLLAGFSRIESWTGHGDAVFAERLREASGAPVAVHRFRGMRDGEHAVDYFARCTGVTPRMTRLPIRTAAAQWAAALWATRGLDENALIIHPGSGSTRKNWEGMAAVAARWRATTGPVVSLAGPAESTAAALPCDVAIRDESLDRVAAAIARGSRYLGNDSGVTHLAGWVGAPGVVLFAASDPRTWQPRAESIRLLAALVPCARCGPDRFCTHRAAVDTVFEALGSDETRGIFAQQGAPGSAAR